MPEPASPSTPTRARVGLVGLGGYAGMICKLLRSENVNPAGRTTLVAGFAPDPENHGPLLEELEKESVRRHASFADLLEDDDVDAVWLPVPIGLHRPMALAALKAGKTVMLEKPVAGCIDDHDAIASAAERSGGTVLIGFQDIYRPTTLDLKRRLLAGEFGKPKAAAMLGLWPRPDDYFARNNWAGQQKVGDAWVLDSPLNNAMAHYVNLALFLLGNADQAAAQPTSVEASLWRARNDIDNFDTCSLRVGLAETCDFTINMSHAVGRSDNPRVEIDTDRGTLHIDFSGRATFDGVEVVAREDGRPHMARALGAAALGETPAPAATLDTSRPHTLIVSAAAQAAPVVYVEGERCDGVSVIPGLVDAAQRAFAERATLPEAGFSPGDTRTEMLDDLLNYGVFSGPALIFRA